MTLLSEIISASAHLHHSNNLPSDEYDNQIRELVEYFRRLQMTKALDSFVNDESVLNPLLGATLVKNAMLRLDSSCAVFTSTHLLLVRLCLQAKAYSCALPVLNKQICHFPISLGRPSSDSSVLCADHVSSISFMTESSGFSSKLSYRDYLQYFLYGGMVYMALKEWHNALHFLGIVISTPSTSSVSLIMVEAYKKWVLDNNLGLVSQVLAAFFCQTVIKLGKTFAALTMADLSKQVFPSPVCTEVTASAVSSLIITRALNATLVQTKDHAETSMLRFSSIHLLPRLSHELDSQSQLNQEMKLMETLVINLGETNNNLELSEEYVDSLHKGQVWTSSSEVNPIVGGEAGLDMDEDLMGDMS
ncbi:COP9 subunit 3, putative [Penicillium digitatum PHI26]|uniref:COP9 subunit 3, putative n=1 Tax=Penicillium digitatum (strain PHI26 / CECT 20796) TaxID=1170229 RepID=K9GBJ8_PEND2|nr:COP9 subunit 3, putative [Penicillium digitatum PHI26]